jgi:hypothetical protein
MVKQFKGILTAGFVALVAACSSSSDGATGDCTTLATCCTKLVDSSNQDACNAVVKNGDTGTCAAAQSDFVNESLCSVATTTSTSSSETGCAGLKSCCGMLPGDDGNACMGIVGEADDTSCTSSLETYQTLGYCGSIGASGPGGGATTLTGCSGLETCCKSLSATDHDTCTGILQEDDNDDTVCTASIQTLQLDYGFCKGSTSTSGSASTTAPSGGSGGSGCAALATCCKSVPSVDQASCNESVSLNDADSCTELLTAVYASYCGGQGGTGSGTGTSTASGGGDCSTLSSCCKSLPAGDQSGCDAIVTANSSADCSAALSEYMTANLCN